MEKLNLLNLNVCLLRYLICIFNIYVLIHIVEHKTSRSHKIIVDVIVFTISLITVSILHWSLRNSII